MTQEQADTLRAMIGVMRTLAVRRHLNRAGNGAPNETLVNTERAYLEARAELDQFITSLTGETQ